MNGPDYEKILNTLPEIIENTTDKAAGDICKKVSDVADVLILVGGVVISVAAIVAKLATKKDA